MDLKTTFIYCFIAFWDIWILKSGCSLKNPTHGLWLWKQNKKHSVLHEMLKHGCEMQALQTGEKPTKTEWKTNQNWASSWGWKALRQIHTGGTALSPPLWWSGRKRSALKMMSPYLYCYLTSPVLMFLWQILKFIDIFWRVSLFNCLRWYSISGDQSTQNSRFIPLLDYQVTI